jgi:hypothetical protein
MQFKRYAIATLVAPLGALVVFGSVGCGAADDATQEGDEAFIAAEEQALRGQRRQPRRNQQPSTGQSSTGSASTSGTSAGTGSAPSSGSPSWSIDPATGAIIVHNVDPNVDPHSGVNYNDLSNAPVETGGRCAGNRAQVGVCPAYGIQCTYEEAGYTRYCTCLHFNSQGIQGWECR